MIVSLIVAVSENGVIGKNNKLPWVLPADLKYFRDITKGHPIIMGRKTFESIGKPLPDRENIVISNTYKTGQNAGFIVFRHILDALQYLFRKYSVASSEEVFLIGGSQLFQKVKDMQIETIDRSLPKKEVVDRIYLTRIHADIDGDTYFPYSNEDLQKEWKEVARKDHTADAENPHAYSFITYERLR